MNRAISFLTAAGVGAGLMYFLDPDKGRRRRVLARDRMMRLSHEFQGARDTVIRDVRNRWRGLAAGDLTVLVGGKNALRGNPLRGSWSPAGRALLGLIGGGLFLRGLTREAPMACILGTAGLALMIEGAANLGIEDITHASSKIPLTRVSHGSDNQRREPSRSNRPGRQASFATS